MIFIKGHYYHIYNRGCNRASIFFNKENYYYLIEKMKKTSRTYGAKIIGYCLMPNHYHYLVRQDQDIPLSEWIRVLFIGYTQAVNRQQNRKGTLFEGRAKHRVIEKEDYLLYLMAYIHVNPVMAGLVAGPEQWKFSNYLDCIGQRKGDILDLDFIRNHFGSRAAYREFVVTFDPSSTPANGLKDYVFDAE